jgi:hypothetical protein
LDAWREKPKKRLKRPGAQVGLWVERMPKTAPQGAVFCHLTTTGTETFVVKTLGKGLI